MGWTVAFVLAEGVVGTREAIPGDPPALAADTLPAELPLGKLPQGLLGELAVPEDNPLSVAKIRLGRKLFFDPILSADGSVACASCHRPEHGFASPDALAVGIRGQVGTRNAPSIMNRALGTSFFWDGRAESLEAQATKPIENPLELGSSTAEAVERLKKSAEYKPLFVEAFAEEATEANLAKALASFERVLIHGNNDVDEFRYGNIAELDDAERHGLWLFESKARCWECHSGPNLTDEDLHNTGVSWGKEPPDRGRFEVTHQAEDMGLFKTPSLRGVALTAPYMHDGSVKTLEDVVRFYNGGGGKNPHLDRGIKPLELSEHEIASLVALLKALTGRPVWEDRGS
jgi:cytochrome c peroxidase